MELWARRPRPLRLPVDDMPGFSRSRRPECLDKPEADFWYRFKLAFLFPLLLTATCPFKHIPSNNTECKHNLDHAPLSLEEVCASLRTKFGSNIIFLGLIQIRFAGPLGLHVDHLFVQYRCQSARITLHGNCLECDSERDPALAPTVKPGQRRKIASQN